MNVKPNILSARHLLHLEPELKARLKAAARRDGESINELIRQAIRAWLKEKEHGNG